jgi:hypothetical protein
MELLPKHVRFTHTPLNFKHKEIRILTIEPSSDPESPVQITIKHIDFSDHIHALTRYQEEKARLIAQNLWDIDLGSDALYNEIFKETLRFIALSYTWGPEFPVQDILVTSPECRGWLSVRQNLYDFLKTRRACGSQWFWIDQICINQGKDDEKTHQVNQMAEIYSAAAVEVWLGSEFEGSNDLIDLIVRESDLLTQEPCPQLSVDKQGLSTHIPSLRRLLCNPYWSRLWVTQEIVLGKVVNIRVGSKALPWNTFFSGCSRVDDAWSRLDYIPKRCFADASAALRIMSINHSRRFVCEDWVDIWSLIDKLECSDLRDKVFGTMGILHPSLRILPDYSMRPHDVLLMLLPKIVESICASNGLCQYDPLGSKGLDREYQVRCMQAARYWEFILEYDADKISRRSTRRHLLDILLPLDPPKFGCRIGKVCLLKYRMWYSMGEGFDLRMKYRRLRRLRRGHSRPIRVARAQLFADDSLFAKSDVDSSSITD